LALRSDGKLDAWGWNAEGQGDVPASEGGTYTQVAAGCHHNLALRSDGAVTAWGKNGSGQCTVPTLEEGVTYTQVAAGLGHSLALRSDGTVAAWGSNDDGQCNVPTLEEGVTYTQVAAGGVHSLALMAVHPSEVIPCEVTKGKLSVNFKKAKKDRFKVSGTFQEGSPPDLTDGLTGTLRIGSYSRDFEIGAKGKSAKDPVLKVRIVEKKSRWRVRVKKADLRAAVGMRNETIAKPGVPLAVPWSLVISNGWMISGTTTFTCTSKEGKKGKGRLQK
ncbi:MAG: RCC1 domain-containing protein, partial [Planctomycetota bacterium]